VDNIVAARLRIAKSVEKSSMKRPNIYEQYKAQYFDPSWLPYLMNRYTTFNLATEFVAHEPGFFAPRQGRIYPTDLWALNKNLREGYSPFIITRTEIHEVAVKHPKWGTFDEHGHGFGIWDLGEEIFMVEHYENYGDDGHTSMELMGYIFVPKSGLELVEIYGRKEFTYYKTLQEQAEKQHQNWKCDLCGRGDCDTDHYGEGFQ
jgi:hypothetical protein